MLLLCASRATETFMVPMPFRNNTFAPFSAMDATSSPRHSVAITTYCPSSIDVKGKAIPPHRSIRGRLLIITGGGCPSPAELVELWSFEFDGLGGDEKEGSGV